MPKPATGMGGGRIDKLSFFAHQFFHLLFDGFNLSVRFFALDEQVINFEARFQRFADRFCIRLQNNVECGQLYEFFLPWDYPWFITI